MLIPSNSIQASNLLPWLHVQPWCLFVVRVVCVVCILCHECCESVVQWVGSCSMYGCLWNTTGRNAVFIGPDNIMVINMGFLVAAHTVGGRGRPSGHVNADYFTGLPQHAAALNIGGWLRAAAASVGDAYFETFDYDMSMRLAAPLIGSGVAAASISVHNFEIFAHNMFMRLATLFIGGDATAAFFNIDKLNIQNLKFKFKPRTVATLKRDVLPLLPLSCVWSSEQGPPPLKHNNFNNIFHFCYFKLFFSNQISSTNFSRQYKKPQGIDNNHHLSFLASCPRTPIFLSPNPFALRSCMFQTKVVKEDPFPSLPRASICVKLHDIVGQGTNVIPQQNLLHIHNPYWYQGFNLPKRSPP